MIGVPERKEGSTIIPSFPVLLEAWPCADEPSVVAQIPVTNGQSNTTPNDDNVNVGTGNENSVDADVLYGAFEQLNLDGEDMKRAVYQRHLEETAEEFGVGVDVLQEAYEEINLAEKMDRMVYYGSSYGKDDDECSCTEECFCGGDILVYQRST